MEQSSEYREQLLESYKQAVRPLLPYLPWLEQSAGKRASSIYSGQDIGVNSVSFPVYDGTLLNFVREATKSPLMDRNYAYVYTRHRIRTHQEERDIIQKAGWKEWDILRGILSKYVLGGRTKGNLWSEAVSEQIFYLVLKQMQEIIEFWDKTPAKALSGERQDRSMGEKSVQKKRYIVEKAREVFVEKGFKKVTMKDIVEACDISRGGLYLYFENTSQIFMEVLRMESEEADDVFSDSITEDATAADILLLFLKEQKKELLRKKNTLTQATYEFYFENELPKRDNILKKQFDSAVKIIEKLIEAGVDNGEFICEDCEGTARNIMFVLEGLKISAQTIGVTAEAVDREILYLLRGLGVED